MTLKIQVAIDCASPALLTRFWALALGYVVEAPPGGFANWTAYWRSVGVPEDELDDIGEPDSDADSIVDPEGVGPRIFFHPVPEGKVVKNRVHLDIAAGGGRDVPLEIRRARVAAKAEELIVAGATRLRVLSTEAAGHYGEVMADPEGNEFCIH
jgi:Glyoxalase-like domain